MILIRELDAASQEHRGIIIHADRNTMPGDTGGSENDSPDIEEICEAESMGPFLCGDNGVYELRKSKKQAAESS